MYGSRYKLCFVPRCMSTSQSKPKKVFLSVPAQYYLKKKWFKAVRRKMHNTKTVFFCCEDHFNLEEDMENYMRYKLMGGRIFLKSGVVPHIFDCQRDQQRTSSISKRLLPIKREKKQLTKEPIVESDKQHSNFLSVSSFNEPSNSSVINEPFFKFVDIKDIISATSNIENIPKPVYKSVGVQAKPSFCSQYISCNLTT